MFNHQNFRIALQRKNMKQTELAEKLGTSKVVVNRWAKGKETPKRETIYKIAEILGTTFEALTNIYPLPYDGLFEIYTKKLLNIEERKAAAQTGFLLLIRALNIEPREQRDGTMLLRDRNGTVDDSMRFDGLSDFFNTKEYTLPKEKYDQLLNEVFLYLKIRLALLAKYESDPDYNLFNDEFLTSELQLYNDRKNWEKAILENNKGE